MSKVTAAAIAAAANAYIPAKIACVLLVAPETPTQPLSGAVHLANPTWQTSCCIS
jgi:hypothetical protein